MIMADSPTYKNTGMAEDTEKYRCGR